MVQILANEYQAERAELNFSFISLSLSELDLPLGNLLVVPTMLPNCFTCVFDDCVCSACVLEALLKRS